MKTLLSNLTLAKYAFLVLLMTLVEVSTNAQRANMTMETYSWHENHIGVNIMISSGDYEAFVLGNQNIRLFYNAQHLTLSEDKIESHLDKNRYTDITISEHDHYDAYMNVNEADYEAVGFLSFNVSLTDDLTGGERVNSNWKKIYTIHFEKNSDFNPADITLALPGLTEELATAFVEVAEWIDPKTSKPMNLTLAPSLVNAALTDDIHLSVGPNPTSDFIYILCDEMMSNVSIYSSNGQKVISKSLNGNEAKIDLSGLAEGLLFVELEDAQGRLYIRQIAKA